MSKYKFLIPGKDKILKAAALLLILIIFFQSCIVPPPQGILSDTWYISDELSIALKFNTSTSGEYISTRNALAQPKAFSLKNARSHTILKMEGRPALRGPLKVFHDRIYLSTKQGNYTFKQYFTKAFPRPPYRYEDEIFTGFTSNEVAYGKAPGYYSSKTVEKRENKTYTQVVFDVAEGITSNIIRREIPLHMDVYEPVGDQLKLRPLIVLLHAGAFIVGDKRDELVSKLAESYAKRGFVVASVNYRLGYLFVPGMYSNLERAMYSALQDVRAAIRYLSHHKDMYRIDPEMVFIGGNSAGGFLSLYAAFIDNTEVWPSARGSVARMQSDLGCLDCSTNDLHGPFTIRGAINMWGAVDDLNIIKSHDKVPVLSIHGDADKVVPYGFDFPFANVSSKASSFFSRRMHGSASIHVHMQSLGLDHTLYTFSGLEHEPHFDSNHILIEENYLIIHDLILSFINRQLVQKLAGIQGPKVVGTQDPLADYWIEQGKYKTYLFECDDCLILNQTPNSARVVWLAGDNQHQLRVAGIGPNGQVYVDTLLVSKR